MVRTYAAHDLVPSDQPAAEEKLGLLGLLLVVSLLLLLWIACSSYCGLPAPPIVDSLLLLAT